MNNLTKRLEWSIHVIREGIFIQSDDFTHDVSIKISGDFYSHEQRLEYVQKITDILNDHGPIVLDSELNNG